MGLASCPKLSAGLALSITMKYVVFLLLSGCALDVAATEEALILEGPDTSYIEEPNTERPPLFYGGQETEAIEAELCFCSWSIVERNGLTCLVYECTGACQNEECREIGLVCR